MRVPACTVKDTAGTGFAASVWARAQLQETRSATVDAFNAVILPSLYVPCGKAFLLCIELDSRGARHRPERHLDRGIRGQDVRQPHVDLIQPGETRCHPRI